MTAGGLPVPASAEERARRQVDLMAQAADVFAHSASLFEECAEICSAVHQADTDLAARVEDARAARRSLKQQRRSFTGR